MKVLFNKRAFIKWLKSRDESEPIVKSGHGMVCPLASYVYQTQPDVQRIRVLPWSSAFKLQTGWREVSRRNPPWARDFVAWVDNTLGVNNWEKLTAGQALEYLEGASE